MWFVFVSDLVCDILLFMQIEIVYNFGREDHLEN